MKGSIKPNHIPVNKFKLLMVGLPEITCTSFSSLEEELQTVDLPDRTRASGGNTNPSEVDIMVPLHHTVEIAAMEAWMKESQDPVTPTYKKAGALVLESVGLLGPTRTYNLVGVFPTKRALPDLEMENEGEMAQVTFTLSIDQILPS